MKLEFWLFLYSIFTLNLIAVGYLSFHCSPSAPLHIESKRSKTIYLNKTVELTTTNSLPSTPINDYREHECSVNCNTSHSGCFKDVCLCDVGYIGKDCSSDGAFVRKVTLNAIEMFEAIYRRNGWNNVFSKSGPGSMVSETTRIRQLLPQILQMTNSKVIFDGGCGDLHWFRHVKLPASVHYIGCDIARSQIQGLRQWFGPQASFDPEAGFTNSSAHSALEDKGKPIYRPELTLFVCDLGALDLRGVVPDLVILRDVLFHIKPEETRLALSSFAKIGAKWLLTTMFYLSDNDRLCEDYGDFCIINFTKHPFMFPQPLLYIPGSEAFGKVMALWKFSDLIALNFLQAPFDHAAFKLAKNRTANAVFNKLKQN